MALSMLVSLAAQAQPSDAQVLKDTRSPRQKSLKLHPGHGSVTWDPERRVHVYTRQYDVVLPSELPGVDVIVFGQAVYQQVVGGPWTHWKDEVFDNHYSGIPNPTAEQIQAFLQQQGVKKILQCCFHRIVGEIQPFQLAPDPKWEWHTPNSVSFNVVTEYRIKESNTRLEHVRDSYRLRLYRNDLKGPWLNLMSTPDLSQRQVLEKEEKSVEEMNALPDAERAEAERAARRAPTVELPAFASARAAADYTYEMLRSADEAKWRAYHRAMLPRTRFNFQPGSDVLLTANAQRTVDQMVENVIKKQERFQREFCPKLKVRGRLQERPGSLQVYFVPKGGVTFCRMVIQGSDGKFGLADIECRVPVGPEGDQIAALPEATTCAP